MMNRLINGMSAIGTIETISGICATVRIDVDVVTPLIRWCVPYAGTVNSQRVPSVGEQVVLLNVAGGDCLSTMVIIGYLHCDAFPAPNSDTDKLTIDTGEYISHTLVDGSQSVTATIITRNTRGENINSDALTVDAPTTFKQVVNGISSIWSKACSAAGISLSKHKHTEQGDGNDVSEPK